MEFFGLTSYGFSSPIKDMLREDYREPEKPDSSNLEANSKDKRSFSEKIKEVDCYLGPADGYAYGSNDRLMKMRKKYIFKPVGPCDIYRYPGVNSMNHGWWQYDQDLAKLSKEDNWFEPRIRHSITTSEMSRFTNHCFSIDKYFRM
ncbi:uncharacterized protein LOC115891072 [Sitophilus oryzae]|uniref:Uncharacterized protein LOC115891072 n=1 Tax=Sitophilus oryzae TaxID=7048 RepID=A0A6J2YTA9_SITOR|nr:uncharacterized protein LOC115891072 [Sitophilus oryzae]